MRVVYDGPIDAVEIPEANAIAVRGEPIEVPDDLGKRLCEQATWSEVKSAKKPAQKEEVAD